MSKTSVKTPVDTYTIDQNCNKSSTISKQKKLSPNAEKGAEYERFVCDYINSTMEDTVAYLWKDVPVDMLIECDILLKSDKKINLCKNVLHDVGIDIIQKNTKTNKFTFIQCKNFIGSLCIKHLSGYCCVMMQSKHLNKDCIVYVSNDKISHYLKKQLENDARHIFVHLPMEDSNNGEYIDTEINNVAGNENLKKYDLICKSCDYSTNRSTDLHRHTQSKKHLLNVEIESAKKENKVANNRSQETPTCNFCGNTFSTMPHMYRHRKHHCKYAKNPELKLKIYMQTNMSAKDNEILLLRNQSEKLISILSEIAKSEKPLDFSKDFTCIKKHFSNNPRLKQLRELSAIELLTCDNKITETDIVHIIMHKYRTKMLIKYFGDLIIKKYKNIDQNLQSIWCIDTVKFIFAIKQEDWICDAECINLTKLIITPILDKVENMMFDQLASNDNYTDSDCELCDEIITKMINKKTHKKIIQYIAPKFKFFLN